MSETTYALQGDALLVLASASHVYALDHDARGQYIEEQLGMSPSMYWKLLGLVLEDPKAVEHAPATIRVLRGHRDREGHQVLQ